MSGIIDTVGSKSGIVGSDVYPAGHILQVKTNNDDTTTSFASVSSGTVTNHGYGQAGTDYTGIDVAITPSSVNHKLFVSGKVALGVGLQSKYGVLRMKRSIGGTFPTFNAANSPWHTATSGTPGAASLVGIATTAALGTSSTQYAMDIPFGYFDSPNTTSEVIYRINFLIYHVSTGATVYINGNTYRGDDYGHMSGTSYMTVMEVKE